VARPDDSLLASLQGLADAWFQERVELCRTFPPPDLARENRMSDRRIVILLAAVLACPAPPMVLARPAVAAQDKSGMAPADMAMMQGMARMQHEMAAAPMTGEPDRDFVAMMLPHHQGAVSMAKVELQYGHDPRLRALARDVITAQDREIVQMRAWQVAHPIAR
jgi:hypothetical protein